MNKSKILITANFVFIALFVNSLFLSVSLASIFFIIGICFYVLNGNLYNSKLKTLNRLILLQITLDFIFNFFHSKHDYNFVILLKNLLRFYLPWFWFTASFVKASNKNIRLLKASFVLMGSFIGFIIFLQVLGLKIGKYALGPSGFQSQPFTTAGLLLISLGLNLNLLESTVKLKNQKSKFFLIGTLTLHLIGLILLSQRAVWLGLLMGTCIYTVLNIKRLGPKKILGFTFASLLTALTAYLFSAKFKNRIQSLLHLSTDKAGVGCRLEIWQQNWQSFLKSPLIGQGRAIEYQCFGDKLGHAHNIYLQQLVVNGLLGFGIWFVFCLLSFKQIILKNKKFSAYLTTIGALFVEGLFENWWGDSEVISAFYFLLTLALI